MTRYEWLLLLHLIGAFAAMGSVVVFSVLLLGGDRVAGAQLTFLGRRLWDVGGMLTLIFGIWLALDVDGYGLLDGWILSAFVLWAIAGGTGVRLGLVYADGAPARRARHAALRGDGDRRDCPARRDDLQARRMTLASVRPDDWNLPLLLHVAGAMVLVALLAAVVVVLMRRAARRRRPPAALRLAFRTLLIGAIPAYIVMRGAAEWIASEANVRRRRRLDRHRLHRHRRRAACC